MANPRQNKEDFLAKFDLYPFNTAKKIKKVGERKYCLVILERLPLEIIPKVDGQSVKLRTTERSKGHLSNKKLVKTKK